MFSDSVFRHNNQLKHVVIRKNPVASLMMERQGKMRHNYNWGDVLHL